MWPLHAWTRRLGTALAAVTVSGCALLVPIGLLPPDTLELTGGVLQLSSAYGLGQGCPISDTLLLTARHVATRPRLMGPAEYLRVVWSDAEGHSGSAETIEHDARRDLALMRADRPFRRWYAVATQPPTIGEPVLIVGYNDRQQFRRHVVQAEILHIVATHLILSDPGLPGFSGSCVLDIRGRVVGIFIAAIGADPYSSGVAVGVYGEWLPWAAAPERP